MREYYCYTHHAGYGQHDHLADEVIARAARALGLDTGDRVAQCVGLASHAVPMGLAIVRLAPAKGVAARMAKALRVARAEMPFRVDCRIDVERRLEQEETIESFNWTDPQTGQRRTWRRIERSVLVRVGREWRTLSIDMVEAQS